MLLYNSSNIRYIFCNKRFNDFLERQISKHKLTFLLRALKFSKSTIIDKRDSS